MARDKQKQRDWNKAHMKSLSGFGLVHEYFNATRLDSEGKYDGTIALLYTDFLWRDPYTGFMRIRNQPGVFCVVPYQYLKLKKLSLRKERYEEEVSAGNLPPFKGIKSRARAVAKWGKRSK
jgi:hypothetical protein